MRRARCSNTRQIGQATLRPHDTFSASVRGAWMVRFTDSQALLSSSSAPKLFRRGGRRCVLAQPHDENSLLLYIGVHYIWKLFWPVRCQFELCVEDVSSFLLFVPRNLASSHLDYCKQMFGISTRILIPICQKKSHLIPIGGCMGEHYYMIFYPCWFQNLVKEMNGWWIRP